MRKISICIISCFLTLSCLSQSIYNVSFTSIDGATVSLNAYQGKKIVFIIAPTDAADSKELDEIMNFQQQLGSDSILLVGIMSIEDGYSASNIASIKSLYQSREVSILLTSGMHTKKSSGGTQSLLMKWLTEKDENGKFDSDAHGTGQKFLINKAGQLIAIVLQDFAITDPLVRAILSKE